MTTVKQHKFLSFAAEQIAKATKDWGAPQSYIKESMKGSRYRMNGDAEAFDHDLRMMHRDASDAFYEYIHNLAKGMQSIRRDRKERAAYQPMARHDKYSRKEAGSVLDKTFPKSRCNIYIKGEVNDNPNAYEVGVSHDGSDYWLRNHVTVSAAWGKTVFDRGIPIVKSSNGLRFILSAKPKDVRNINSEMTRVFEVKAFGIHQKKAFREDGWLMVHGDSDAKKPVWDYSETEKKLAQNNVHAFHQYLGDCKALFDRRVKKYVIDQFDI